MCKGSLTLCTALQRQPGKCQAVSAPSLPPSSAAASVPPVSPLTCQAGGGVNPLKQLARAQLPAVVSVGREDGLAHLDLGGAAQRPLLGVWGFHAALPRAVPQLAGRLSRGPSGGRLPKCPGQRRLTSPMVSKGSWHVRVLAGIILPVSRSCNTRLFLAKGRAWSTKVSDPSPSLL